MATIGCDLTTLVNDAKCFQCFSEKQNQAALVYFLEQVRAQKAGNAVRTPNQLRTATAGLANFPVDPVADAADVAVAQQWAQAAGVAGASTQTIAAINRAIVQFANMSLDDLRTIEILIRCNLAAF